MVNKETRKKYKIVLTKLVRTVKCGSIFKMLGEQFQVPFFWTVIRPFLNVILIKTFLTVDKKNMVLVPYREEIHPNVIPK